MQGVAEGVQGVAEGVQGVAEGVQGVAEGVQGVGLLRLVREGSSMAEIEVVRIFVW